MQQNPGAKICRIFPSVPMMLFWRNLTNGKTVLRPKLPELKQKKTDIIAYLNETEKEMQAEIALFHGEAVAFIARHIRTQYGKTYWQAQGEALTVWNILRRNQIKQAVKEGRDDAAERLLQECREKFGMPDYLATASAAWFEHASDSLH